VLDRARKDAMEALKFAVGEKMLDRALWIIREDGLYGKEFWDLDAENKRNGEMWRDALSRFHGEVLQE